MPPPDLDRVSALLRTYLFEDLSPAELEPLARASTARQMVRGEFLFHIGDPADALYVVVSGQLKDSILTEDGEEIIHSVYGPGMLIGEPGFFVPERNRVMAVIALEPSTLVILGREPLQSFLQRHPQVTMRLLEGVSSIARHATELVVALARRPLAERLLLCLLDLADTNTQGPDGRSVTPKISQTTLAGMVGATRENVNRAVAGLASRGTIRIEAGRYVIVDPIGARSEVSAGWPLIARLNRRKDG